MRKRIVAAALGAALLGAPAAAQGAPQQAANPGAGWKPYEKRYLELRHDYVKELGLREAGRDIVRDGYREQDGDVRVATPAEVRESTGRMDASLHPAEPTATAPVTSTTPYSSSASSSTVQCESGGDYGAVNPAGYYGAYQFDQGTWDAYAPAGYAGTNPAAAPPAVQDAAAASVPYDAWPSC
jgi:hypothetical protein